MFKKLKLLNGKLIEAEKDDNGLVLIYCNPTQEEKTELVDAYKIDEHNLLSALDPDEVGRLEFEPNHIAIILKRPKNYISADNFLFKTSSVGVFIFKNKLIIIMSEDIQILEGRQTKKLHTPLDILLKLLYGTISHFLGHLRTINMISDNIESKINSAMENKSLLNMFTLEKSLVYYLNGISSNAMIFEKIKINAKKFGFTEENTELLDDIIIENNQCLKQAEIYSNILSSLMDARASIVNNNLNLLIKRLTIINIVFMPLNVIAGMGGMSEFSAMTSKIPYWVSYSLFSAGMIVIAFLTYLIIRGIGFEKKSRKGKKNIC